MSSGGGGDYPSQEIFWIVPYGTGGGFDTYTRALAEFMPERLPEEVDMPVDNVTGAGGRIGTTEIYNAEPDGYTAGIFNIPGLLAAQLAIETNYDLREVTWFGIVDSPNYMLVTSSSSDIETLDDVLNADETLDWGDPGISSSAGLNSVVIAETLGIDVEWVTGFDGTQQTLAALYRNDIDLFLRSPDVLRTPYEDGEIRILSVFADEPPEYATDAPTAAELGHDEVANMGLHRMIGGPPDISDDRAEIFEDALMDTLNSDEMQEWAEEQERPINPSDGATAESLIEDEWDVWGQHSDVLADILEG